MFFRMIRGTLVHQWKKMLMIAITIALGASLATAMISVVLDVSDKVNQELKTYGANITVKPAQSTIISGLYELDEEDTAGSYLNEEELGNVKAIFWANNIVDYAPFISTDATVNGSAAEVVGTWFNHHMTTATGEEIDSGILSLRSWWDISSGSWYDEQVSSTDRGAMVGCEAAEALGLSVGDSFVAEGPGGSETLTVMAVFESGDDDDGRIFTTVDAAQAVGGLDGCIDSIEVSALTVPDDDLAVKAAKDPDSLTVAQYEIWYCKAYVSSICFQIQEAVSGSVASAVRQVADSEGAILDKTKLLMVLIMALSLVGSALGISNLVTASVMERSQEIGLMKAVGAHGAAINALVLTEILITAILGGIVGFFAGLGFAQIIGMSVFGSAITMRVMVIPIVAVLVVLVTLAGSVPAIRTLLKLEPAAVLHGR